MIEAQQADDASPIAGGRRRRGEDEPRRWTSLRREDLDDRFPGLLDAVTTVAAAAGGGSRRP